MMCMFEFEVVSKLEIINCIDVEYYNIDDIYEIVVLVI